MSEETVLDIHHGTGRAFSFKTTRDAAFSFRNGKLYADLGVSSLDTDVDRAMVCGGAELMTTLRQLTLERGGAEGHRNEPGQFVIEKAFVDP